MTPEQTYLFNILVFLVSSVGVLFVFRYLRISSVLAYLVAGMLIGPHIFNIIADPPETRFLGELGVTALLFTLGLDLPLQRLNAMKTYIFWLAAPQVILTSLVFMGLALWTDLSKEVSLLVASALSLSSTAVVLQVLDDRREFSSKTGRISFAILLFQDLMVVLLLILATGLSRGVATLSHELGYAALKAILALSLIIALGRYVFRPFYRLIALRKSAELFMGTTFLLVLGMAYLTESLGLSMELGAFLAGMLLAETEYRHQVEADIQPFRGLLLGIFFMSVGMEMNIGSLSENFRPVMIGLALMIALKSIITFILARLNKIANSTSFRVALLLAGGGEFVFVIFSPSVAGQMLTLQHLNILFLIVALSMAATPLLATLGKIIGERLQAKESYPETLLSPEEESNLKEHIIIAGFGRVGQMLGDILDSRLIPYVAIDVDMQRIAEGRSQGRPVFYGDVKNIEVLKAVGVQNAKAIVVTLNHVTASVRAVLIIRRCFPDIPVCVRIKDHKHREKLLNSGALLVVPETVEPTIQLADSLLHLMGVPQNEIQQLIERFRQRVVED